MTTQEHLDLVEAAIAARLSGDAFEAYTEAGDRFEGASLAELYKIRNQLRQEIIAGTNFYLAEPREG